MKRILMIAAMPLFLMAACGADIGEACDTSGSQDECTDGAVCTNANDATVCRKECTEQSDCDAGESCNGISGTNIKSCQPG